MARMTYKERMKLNRERHLKYKLENIDHWEDKARFVKDFYAQERANEHERQMREQLKKEQNEMDSWINSNNTIEDVKLYTDYWNQIEKRYKKKMLKTSVKHLAMYEAAENTNKALKLQLKLSNADLDLEDFQGYLNKLHKVELISLVINSLVIPPKYKEELKHRIISREFPTKDNVSASPKQDKRPNMEQMMGAVRQGIRSEVTRMNKDGR